MTRFLREQNLAGKRLIVAVSGGPDSLALLLALYRLRDSLAVDLHVAHLDHRLRGDSGVAAAYVRRVAARLGLPVTVAREDVQSYRRVHRLSVEEAARQVRYTFLGRVAQQQTAAAVLTGHTTDDQVETILLNLQRGAGLAGLRGMQPLVHLAFPPGTERVAVGRPLLSTRRIEILAYCRQRRLRPHQDPSNLDRTYRRNHLRLDVIPRLEETWPGAVNTLLNLAWTAGRAHDGLEGAADVAWPHVARWGDASLSLDRASLMAFHPALRRALLRRATRELVGEPSPLAQVHYQAIEELLRRPPPRSMNLPQGLQLTTGYDRAILGIGPPPCPLPFLEAGPLTAGETVRGGWCFRVQEKDCEVRVTATAAQGGPSDLTLPRPLTALLTPEQAAGGLAVRPRQAGDRLRTSQGSRKVQDILVDAKVPRAWRDRVPLVCRADSGELLWVVGVRGPAAASPLGA